MSTLTLAKRISIAGGTALFALGTVNMISPAQAASLNLNYTVENLTDGWFNYSFQLKVDNTDNSYIPGEAWRWIIFGDKPFYSPDPPFGEGTLPNWVGDLSKSSPWIKSFSSSNGGHNGPTLDGNSDIPVLTWWIPSDVNDYLYWSGKSTANLSQGELLFSTLAGTLNGATPADFKVANQVDSLAVPEPLTVFGSILGLGVLGAVKRKRK
jgi:PEP-CTERM putative exosortase interaction domain